MGILKRLAHVVMRSKPYKATLKVIAEKLPYTSIVAAYHERNVSEGGYKRQAKQYQAKEIKDWVMGVTAATDPNNPRRSLLFRFYENLLTDEHLQTTIDNRVLPLQQASFIIVDKNDKEQKELTQLIEKPWLHELHRLFIMHKLQGPTLVRMSELNDNLELASVEEYPQSNFIAQRGIIINEEYDEKGVSYREGALANYFVQFGNDWALGMLNELAVIILAKKLGMGSWISYIEKYGVPPIFAITDRLDDTRTQELYDMLSAFQSEHFAVLKGNEKIEFGKDLAGDGKSAFGPLIDYADRKISTRLLGQTGTTSNEAYTGTAFVHERVEETRHNADKLLFMYYFNDIIIPKLVKISPVYAALDGCKLKWDNAEKLTVSEYIDGIVKLKDQFEFDDEEVRSRTGLPIVGKKTQLEPTEPQPPKKVSATVEDDLLSPVAQIAPTAEAFDSIIDRVMQAVYDEKVKTGYIDKDLYYETYKQLNNQAAKGWGKDYYNYDSGNIDTTQTMRNNIYWFSGAKSYQQIKEINELMYDDKGNKRPYTEFRSDVLSRNKEYNENYLSAEFDTAFSSAQMAEKWAGYEADKKVFPNLKYVAVNDSSTRASHAALNGTVKPVDDPFWSLYYPPNGFRCRCHVEQTTEESDEKTPRIDLDDRFAQNVGKTGTPFSVMHPYFSMPKKVIENVKRESEQNKIYAPYHKDKTSDVMISEFCDNKDFRVNIENARILSNELDLDIKIRAHINVDGVKNPEFLVENKLGDLKVLTSIGGIKHGLASSKKQKCNYTVFNLNALENITPAQINNKLRGIANQHTDKYNAQDMIFIKDGKAAIITWDDLKKGKVEQLLKKTLGAKE